MGWPRSSSSRGVALGLLCALACWLLGWLSWVEALDNWARDGLFMLRGPRASRANVVVIALDDASLDELHKPLLFASPELARVIEHVLAQGADVAALDVLAPATQTTIAELLPGRVGDASAVGRVVARTRAVVLPAWLLPDGDAVDPLYEWGHDLNGQWTDLAYVNLTIDDDTFARRQQLAATDGKGRPLPSLALAAYARRHNLPAEWLAAPKTARGGRVMPLDDEGLLAINYAGPPGAIEHVSFSAVLAAARGEGPSPRDWRGAAVFIGVTSHAQQDRHGTPYMNRSWASLLARGRETAPADRARFDAMAGVEIHANVFATLEDEAFITTPWWLAAPWPLLALGAALGLGYARWNLEAGLLLAAVAGPLWFGFAWLLFARAALRVDLATPMLLGWALYGTVFAMRWRWIRRMMGLVKSEAVARVLEAGPAALDPRGQQLVVTVLFCDVRGFTTYCEGRAPRDVVRLLNELFGVIVPALEAEGGVVNQYIGDAVMVLFGAPRPQADAASRATRAAREVLRRVRANAARWERLGAPGLRVGVGVHTGPAVVGAIGSPQRLDYTAIGDTVNTAARLEEANKELGSELVVSEAVLAALPPEEQHRLLSETQPHDLRVRGRHETLRVHARPATNDIPKPNAESGRPNAEDTPDAPSSR